MNYNAKNKSKNIEFDIKSNALESIIAKEVLNIKKLIKTDTEMINN